MELIESMDLSLLIELTIEFKKIIINYFYHINEKTSLKVFGGIDKINNLEEYKNINFCYNNEVINLLYEKSKIIKLIYPFISNKEIFIIMIYIYYILNLIENISFPFYTLKNLINPNNEKYIINIINNVTMFDIIYKDINISSNIRQTFLFGNNIEILQSIIF
jgi:hypothetical protein